MTSLPKTTMNGDYGELKRLILQEGLLKRQPLYYAKKLTFTFLLLVASAATLILVSNPWLQMLNAAFLAFIFVQVGLIMHDAEHMQIFESARKNETCGLIVANLIIGISSGRWRIVHNRHHGSPNQEGEDPDIDIPILAFSQEQALRKKGFARFITKYQAFFWPLLTSLQAFRMRIVYFITLLRNLKQKDEQYPLKHPALEALLVVVSSALYFGAVFTFLDFQQALLFVLVHHLINGLYMVSIFATNHKGMPLLKEKMDFLRMQVVTARNIKSNPLVHLWMGGLDYQIEHHLFPTMPRSNLKKAKKIVKPYCEKHGIPYYETGFFRSYVEILGNFHRASAVLRKK